MKFKKQLAQSRPANTTAVSIISMDSVDYSRVDIHSIIVCNTTSSAATFRIFHDEDGSTYDETTALFYDSDVLANETISIEFDNPIVMREETANLAVRSSSGDAITYTVYGAGVNE